MKNVLTIVAFAIITSLNPETRADSLNFLDHPPAGKMVAEFNFNEPSNLPKGVALNPKFSSIESGADAIDQTPALVSRANEEKDGWFTTFEIKPGYMQPHKYYRVSFDYKILEASPEDGQVYFYVRPDNPDKRGRTTSYLGNDVGIKKHKIYEIVTGDEANCGFGVGIKKRGAVAIDNIRFEELPRIATENAIKLQPVGQSSWKNLSGVCTHMTRKTFYKSEDEIIKMLDLLKDLGIGTIRMDMEWRAIYPDSPDKVDEPNLNRMKLIVNGAHERGLKVCAIIGSTPKWAVADSNVKFSRRYAAKNIFDYEKYVRFVATTFKGKIQVWEINNETNWFKFWEAPFSDYLNELHSASKILREVDSNNFILSAGLAATGFVGIKGGNVQALYDLLDPDVAKDYDALAIHSYPRNTDEMLYTINNIVALMKEKKVVKKIWITETGFSVAGKATEEDQANFIEANLTKLAAHPYVDKIILYNERAKEQDDNPFERGLGIIRYDLTPRPVYERLKKLFSGGVPEKNPAFAGETP